MPIGITKNAHRTHRKLMRTTHRLRKSRKVAVATLVSDEEDVEGRVRGTR